MTQEEYDELQRQFLEPRERRTEATLPLDVQDAEARALEAAKQSTFDESLYMGGPQASEEDLRRALQESESRAEQRIEEAKQVCRRCEVRNLRLSDDSARRRLSFCHASVRTYFDDDAKIGVILRYFLGLYNLLL